MVIFTYIGIAAVIVIVVILVVSVHFWIWERYSGYRILCDWLLIPHVLFWQIPYLNKEQIESAMTQFENSPWTQERRYLIAKWAMKRRLKKLEIKTQKESNE